MPDSQHELLIGTCGWQHAAWSGSFYPDDLPEDWQLGYYGNEFRVVLVPRACREAGGELVAQWLEDCGDHLQFICEVAAGTQSATEMDAVQESLAHDLAWAERFGDRAAGILCNVAAPLGAQNGALESILQALAGHAPVCIDLGGDVPVAWQRELLERYGAGWCWHGRSDHCAAFTGRLAITRIAGERAPRELRTVVETCLVQGRSMRQIDDAFVNVLLLDGDPPVIETARQAGVILELL